MIQPPSSNIRLKITLEQLRLIVEAPTHLAANTSPEIVTMWQELSALARERWEWHEHDLEKYQASLDLNAENLPLVLQDAQKRHQLCKALRKERGGYRPLYQKYEELATSLQASPDVLEQIVYEILKSPKEHDESTLLGPLSWHPEMPVSALFALLDREEYVIEIAHRRGPQVVLERVAEEFRVSEAITSLALFYYSSVDSDTDVFAAFLERHAQDKMLRYNMVNVLASLPQDKQEVVRTIFNFATGP